MCVACVWLWDPIFRTIEVSSLPAGDYCITIESPAGNTYEGFFEIY